MGTERRGPEDPGEGPTRRERILDVAIDEFALHGFAAVRIDRLADLAGCNKQLIYYYFGSKAGLHDAVYDRLMELARPHWDAMTSGTYREAVLELLDWTAGDTYSRRYVRLLVMEELDAATSDRPRTHHEDERRDVWQRSIAQVRSRQDAGEIDPAFDPRMVALIMRVLVSMPHVLPQVTRTLTGQQPSDPRFTRRLRATLLMLTEALEPGRADHPPAASLGGRWTGDPVPAQGDDGPAPEPADTTRPAQILDAAVHEFAVRGFAAARIDTLAEAAACNKQSIYYHYKSKLGLYEAVLDKMMAASRREWLAPFSGDLRQWIADQIATSTSPRADVWLRLLVMEGLDDAAGTLPGSDHEPERVAAWRQAVPLAQDSAPAGSDPAMVAMLFVFMALAPRILPRMTTMFTGMPPDHPEFAARYTEAAQLLLDRLGRLERAVGIHASAAGS